MEIARLTASCAALKKKVGDGGGGSVDGIADGVEEEAGEGWGRGSHAARCSKWMLGKWTGTAQ